MSGGFRINSSSSFSSVNTGAAVYGNQFPDAPRGSLNEIVFLGSDGSPISTPNFVYIPNVSGETGAVDLIGINGDLQVNGSVAFLSHIGVGEINNGRFVEISADTMNNAYIDFHSRDTFTSDFDSRILSNGGASGPGNGNLFFQAGSANFNCPVRLGSWGGNPFRLDYGQLPLSGDVNQTGEQTFVTDMFVTPPYVTLTLQSDGQIRGDEAGLRVLTSSCASFFWAVYGTPALNSHVNWIALGV